VQDERLFDVADDNIEISERAPGLRGQAADAQWSIEDQGGDERSAIAHDSGLFYRVLRRLRGGGSFTAERRRARSGSFDDVVGAEHQRLWNHEADSLHGLETQTCIEMGRPLDRQVSRLGSPENAIDVGRRLLE
jgi:hypothetical protein